MHFIALPLLCLFFFFFNDTATTEIYTLSLHDALPIWSGLFKLLIILLKYKSSCPLGKIDRKSTRLNSSHITISYAVFCLKKKKHHPQIQQSPNKTKKPKRKNKPSNQQ